jgi:Cu(I)/Ag(I) efflux system membrane protein CusA/SilA
MVENQVTYPLTTTMLSVPGAKAVRGYSLFGDSFVYVLFEDGTDLYWARSRVLEYLNQVQGRLPAAAKPGARPGRHRRRLDLPVRAGGPHRPTRPGAAARLQDWFLRFELKACPTWPKWPASAAWSQYQVVLDPDKLAPTASRTADGNRGRATRQPGSRRLGAGAWAKPNTWCAPTVTCALDDFRADPAQDHPGGVPVRLGDVATCNSGPRCGAASPNSTARAKSRAAWSSCARARTPCETIDAVKARLAAAEKRACPRGRDRAGVRPLRSDRPRRRQPRHKLLEEFVVVAVVCAPSSGTCARRWLPSSRCRWAF